VWDFCEGKVLSGTVNAAMAVTDGVFYPWRATTTLITTIFKGSTKVALPVIVKGSVRTTHLLMANAAKATVRVAAQETGEAAGKKVAKALALKGGEYFTKAAAAGIFDRLNLHRSAGITDDEACGATRLSDTKIPLRSLCDSNYLRCYKSCSKTPSVEVVRSHLPESIRPLFDTHLQAAGGTDLRVACVRLWSDSGADARCLAYKHVNQALLSDNGDLLKMYVHHPRPVFFCV